MTQRKVFLIQSEGAGRGEEQLGSLLMANLLRLWGESQAKTRKQLYWNTIGLRKVRKDRNI